MSAPVVGGAIALWLQANPSLSPDDIFHILQETADRSKSDTPEAKSCSWGYGEIDVYAGLLKALGVDGVEGISAKHPVAFAVSSCVNGKVVFAMPDGEPSPQNVHLFIYSVSGSLLAKRELSFSSGQGIVSIEELPSGVYVLQAVSTDSKACGSFLVRR